MANNNQIIQVLIEEKKKLESILKRSYGEIKKAPAGTIQIKKHHQSLQFYHRSDPHMRDGQYIPAAEREKVIQLVQKSYLENICKAAEIQLKAISSFLNKYDPDVLQRIYEAETESRKKFLTPVEIPDELYASAWQSVEYERKGFPIGLQEHYTRKNERVRSKSEVLIADALNISDIPYRYEYPLNVNGKTFHPDFTILRMYDRKIFYWEHLGLMDDPEYGESACGKIREYMSAGIFLGDNLIITMETSDLPLNHRIISNTIEHYLLP